MSTSIGIGNELNRVIQNAMSITFTQGELAQLSHSSFEQTATAIQSGDAEEIEVNYPIGYTPEKEPMLTSQKYNKEDLIQRYNHLAFAQIPMNGIYQLVTIVEAMFSDLIRHIILFYPDKLSAKRQISLQDVLKASAIEELHLLATNAFIHELSYKSPTDFAKEAQSILSVNLLECPAFHKYIEMKATRDVLIHNMGIANDIYVGKAGSHARVQAGQAIPITQVYFLEVYEACLQLIEWLEIEINKVWHSSEFEERRKTQTQTNKESPSAG